MYPCQVIQLSDPTKPSRETRVASCRVVGKPDHQTPPAARAPGQPLVLMLLDDASGALVVAAGSRLSLDASWARVAPARASNASPSATCTRGWRVLQRLIVSGQQVRRRAGQPPALSAQTCRQGGPHVSCRHKTRSRLPGARGGAPQRPSPTRGEANIIGPRWRPGEARAALLARPRYSAQMEYTAHLQHLQPSPAGTARTAYPRRATAANKQPQGGEAATLHPHPTVARLVSPQDCALCGDLAARPSEEQTSSPSLCTDTPAWVSRARGGREGGSKEGGEGEGKRGFERMAALRLGGLS